MYFPRISGLLMLSTALSLPSFAGPAFAQVCTTLPACRAMEARTQVSLSQTQARLRHIQARIRQLGGNAPVVLEDVARDAQGRIRSMDHYEAVIYCHQQGMRLPTPRELAMHSQSLGAIGIRETAYPGATVRNSELQDEIFHMRRDGYHPVYTASSSVYAAVDFYFNYGGYRRQVDDPVREVRDYWLWSSAVHPESHFLAYGLGGESGNVSTQIRLFNYDKGVVRCVRSLP